MNILRENIRTAAEAVVVVLASAMAFVVAAPAAAAPLLINGDFETPDQLGNRSQISYGELPGWTYQAGPVLNGYDVEITSSFIWGFAAASGKQYLDFGGNSSFGASISQSFATTPGDVYLVTYATGEQQGDGSAQIMRAIVTSGAQMLVANNTNFTNGFSAGKPITFTATGTTAKLTFFDATPDAASSIASNIILDAVLVSEQSVVPEPATWALLMTGFGMVGSAVRARRGKGTVVVAKRRARSS